MNHNTLSFQNYIISKYNRRWLFFAIITGIVYFIILRFLFPIPSFYADSFTWIGAAQTGQPVSFRPVGYSKLIFFCKLFSVSDVALIAAQYFTNLFVNLFLFFSCTFLFSFSRLFKLLLYVLLIINPLYLFYSNYVYADAFFSCFTVLWFTLLIWIMHKPSWPLIVAQLIVLAGLFELRYNALFFPAIAAIALLLAKQGTVKKIISMSAGFVLIAIIVIFTQWLTKNYTGTNTFSAFSGWQLANDALHVMQHDKIDTTLIEDKEVKALVNFNVHFFDTARQTFPDSGASAVFMWHINSPLKRYMHVYPGRSKFYFRTWNALGPVYSKFGKAVILQKPWSYFTHFVLPNAKAYIFPPLEMYKTYMEDSDTIAAVASKYFHYKTNKTPAHHPAVYSFVFIPVQILFVAVNFIFITLGLYYFLSGKYKTQPLLFNNTLVCFAALYIINFFFVVLLAPSVIRYHIFILTLSFPVVLYLMKSLMIATKARRHEVL